MKIKTRRMFTGKRRWHKFDIAKGQLETAIRLFLVDGADMFSAITLAGAAGELFQALVVRAGKEPFIDSVVQIEEQRGSPTPARGSIHRHINGVLFINEMKHLDKGRGELIEFDAEECALGAILKAIADYKTLTGEETEAMKAFLAWCYINLDSATIMKEYENRGERG